MTDLKDRIESDVVNYSFSMKVPKKYWDEFYDDVDGFCKSYYGDVRWVMVADLVRRQKEDFKFQMLYDEIQLLKLKEDSEKKPEPEQKGPRCFGSSSVWKGD